MRMRALQNAVWVSLCAIALAVPAAQAQQQPQQSSQQPSDQSSGPIPAYRSPLASAAGNDQDDEEPQELAPDNRSLSGAQNLSLGIPTARSYWQPHFDVSATADSNALQTPKSAGWGEWTSISGGVDVHRTSGSNDMTLSYTSGGMISNNPGVSNGIVQGLSFADSFAFRRSSLSFFDELSYLPEASLGFGGLGGIGLPGSGLLGLSPGFATGQSILTGQGQNFGNSFATELNTFLTPRTSLTFVGGYSLLHNFDSGLIDFGEFTFSGGYNYQMTRSDTLAVLYIFSGFRFSNFNQSIDAHSAEVAYGRRITGRLAFQVAAGPQVLISRAPVTGGSGSTAGGPGTGSNFTQLYWALNTGLQWQAGRTPLKLSYSHSATGGSGVFAGAITDIVRGSATHQVSRTFSDGISVGYSRNESLAGTSSAPSNQTYDYWFAGASLSHPVGRALGLTFGYEIQYQTSNSTFCIGPTCGSDVIRHAISVGVGWHERPLLF